jgi:hypothetical protein
MREFLVPSLGGIERDRERRRRRESSPRCLSLRGGDHELERILEGAGRPRSRRSSYPLSYAGGTGGYACLWLSCQFCSENGLKSLHTETSPPNFPIGGGG